MNESTIFNAAVKLPVGDRPGFLAAACAENADLQANVESLLREHEDESGGFLNGISLVSGDKTCAPITEQIGTHIGPYKLLEQIGEGGMGVVYVAEQTEPVRRRVALKIIKPGMDTKQVIARFEAERQALAMMDHPHIAKVLDAGATDAGRPYFVMELVRGLPVTEYCDKARLSPRQRLELFIDVCHAVQHAHQKGVIHRDLKPSNVMITVHDGRPVAKVIDFGVAKAVGQQLTERTVYTAHTQLVGTPLYMSPEQADFSSQDVDTRSDVYSLGVLLYELLTGQTPFDKETLTKAGFDEMRRIIREDEPPSPSRRFSTLGAQASSTVSQHRSVDERHLGRVLRGELDWIVMKALEKDRSRRYESASNLAADIQRYLSDEPVLACPPTTMYRFQKFARKHKPALATAAVVAASLVLGTTVSAWQAARATTAEAQANANANQAKEKAQEASAQRDEAQKQRDEVRALADRLQRTLYASNMNLAQHALDAGTIGRVEELLDQHRPKPEETDLRGFEWYYLKRLCHAELLTLKGGTGSSAAHGVAFSPDGKRLASTQNGLKVWDAQTGTELLSLKVRGSWTVAFSPDGKRLASTSNHGDDSKNNIITHHDVKVWDAQTGQELLTIPVEGNTGSVWCVAYSPDGKRLAAATGDYDQQRKPLPADVKVWDSLTGEAILTLKGHTGPVLSVAYSPDGKRLAATSFDEIKVWDARTGQELLSLKGDYSGVAFSPDSKRLASGGREAKVCDAETGHELVSLKRRAGSMTFSPDGKRLASGALSGEVRVCDAETGQELLVFRGHTNEVTRVAFSPDGARLVSGSRDGTVKIWDATAGPEARTINGHTDNVRSVILSPDGKQLAGVSLDTTTTERAVMVWDARTGQELLSLKQHAGRVLRVIFSPDGKGLVSAGGTWDETKNAYVAGEVKVWNAQTGQELLTFKGHTSGVLSVAYSPDGTRLASSSTYPNGIGFQDSGEPGEVKVWDAKTGQELLSLKGHTRFVNCVAFSPDGKRLATISGDNTIRVWDAVTGQELLSLKANSFASGSVAFSPDGKRLASSSRAPVSGFGPLAPGEVKVWDAQTGQELLSLKGHTARIASVVFSPDGKRLASGAGGPGGVGLGELKVWDAQTGQELLTLKGGGYHDGISFSPDGHRLASDLGGKVTIWDATPLPEKP